MEQHEILSALEAATHQPASPLHFTPVRVRARRDGWTERRQRRFIAAVAVTGRIALAAELVGMTEQTARRLCRRPDGASFCAACAAACTLGKRARYARRARAAAAREGAKGSEPDFRPMQAEPSETSEPSAARSEPSGRPAAAEWHV